MQPVHGHRGGDGPDPAPGPHPLRRRRRAQDLRQDRPGRRQTGGLHRRQWHVPDRLRVRPPLLTIHRGPLPGDPPQDLPRRSGPGVPREPGAGPAAYLSHGGPLRPGPRGRHGGDRVDEAGGGLAVDQGAGGVAGSDEVYRSKGVYNSGWDELDGGGGL